MDDKRKFNKFFYDTQQHRMLGIGYIFLTKEGILFTIFVLYGIYSGYMSFFYIFGATGGFAYIYIKLFNATLKEREEIWLIKKIKEYLEIEI